MMVTFVSQCEKNALKKTRRVLDAFANRIGDSTWQTLITEEGLNIVKKLLRRTASRNTAVSCHWTRNRHQSELVWIVGNRRKFNSQGLVPVNRTQKNLINTQWESDWRYLPLIKALTALAALFHDWGKSSDWFQAKLKASKIVADPLRHEWISCLFITAFSQNTQDSEWLQSLIDNPHNLIELSEELQQTKAPFISLPPASQLLIWLILSHHRLPHFKERDDAKKWYCDSPPADDLQTLLQYLTSEWSYQNSKESEGTKACFKFSKGLPSQSLAWQKQVKKWAAKLLDCNGLIEEAMRNGAWRQIIQFSRTALMLGDHYYSSQDTDPKLGDENFPLYANTDRQTQTFKQRLDEHLIGVMQQALKAAHLLPSLNGTQLLPTVQDIRSLKQKSPKEFQWQDQAVQQIQNWRKTLPEHYEQRHFGFFAVNMASTGKGKTFANAKIMRALSENSDSLRYSLALGLRTLTLQTGDEYRHRIGLDSTELAVQIGSQAVLELHNHKRSSEDSDKEIFSGSESEDYVSTDEIDFEVELNESLFSTILTDDKSQKFLYAPVLACTIDYLMNATESLKGGRHLLPLLRLLSADLVIDEIDDFDSQDLMAISRLIHLAGMLGRKVMISSATIPPDLALGLFNAYQTGWHIFSQTREVPGQVGCAWIDEFHTVTESFKSSVMPQVEIYQTAHQNFIDKRINTLNQQPVKRKACLVTCDLPNQDPFSLTDESETNKETYFKTIQQSILQQHEFHAINDPISSKQVSFGVVRMANISSVIELTQYLSEAKWPADIEIRTMPYHSQQILLMRHMQEAHLDEILKRKDEQAIFSHTTIRQHLNEISQSNVIFILVATPVEEIGRDHDFDWAIIEPSSFRSIIQLAGRVLRHRDKSPKQANIALLQYNLKAFQQANSGVKAPVFNRPGYESSDFLLETHDLSQLLNWQKIEQKVDAQPRIHKPNPLTPNSQLADLEHYVMQQILANFSKQGASTQNGWLKETWWLTGLPQQANPFREGNQGQKVYAVYEDEKLVFKEKFFKPIFQVFPTIHQIERKRVTEKMTARQWLKRDYKQFLYDIAKQKDISYKEAGLRYGELTLPIYNPAKEYVFEYSHELGLTNFKH